MLNVGKLDSDVLQRIVIDKISYKRPEVKVHSGIGEDCGVIGFGDWDCIVSTDPITASIKDVGRLSIHISCNDIASNGVEPLAITLAVMLPVGTTEEDVEEIMEQAGKAAENAGVEIIGGHTEVTEAVSRPVIVSTAFGRTVSDDFQKASDMEPGDYILMTKWAGLEGSGIIAGECEAALKDILSAEELSQAKGMLDQVSVVKEGVLAGKIGTAGMHDVTEGGILGAVWEMCHISGLGCRLWKSTIPVHEVTRKIGERFGIDVLRLISSGSMLIIAKPEKKDALMKQLEEAGIEVSCIGLIEPAERGLKLQREKGSFDGEEDIEPPTADELYKAIK